MGIQGRILLQEKVWNMSMSLVADISVENKAYFSYILGVNQPQGKDNFIAFHKPFVWLFFGIVAGKGIEFGLVLLMELLQDKVIFLASILSYAQRLFLVYLHVTDNVIGKYIFSSNFSGHLANIFSSNLVDMLSSADVLSISHINNYCLCYIQKFTPIIG